MENHGKLVEIMGNHGNLPKNDRETTKHFTKKPGDDQKLMAGFWGGAPAPPQTPHLRGGAAAPPHPSLMSASGLPNYWLFNKDLIKKTINGEANGR